MARSRSSIVFISALALSAPLVFAPMMPVPAASAACSDYVFIGARGSGEDPTPTYASNDFGMGKELQDVWSRVSAQVVSAGKTIEPYGLHYPAVKMVDWSAARETIDADLTYAQSVQAGQVDFENELSTVHAACPSTQFIVTGYSQGAQTLGDAIGDVISPSLRSLIAASAFFGDPRFDANDSTSGRSTFDPSYYGLLGPRTLWADGFPGGSVTSYCHDGDPICGLLLRLNLFGSTWFVRDLAHIFAVAALHGQPGNPLVEHQTYVEEHDTEKAAQDILDALHLPSTAPTSYQPSDTVFVIDSTGSMGGEIDNVEANVDQLAASIASTSADYRFALVDYKDDPSNDSPYQARVDVPFTSSASTFTAGVDSISASGGGDLPESVYDGVMTGLNLPWRDGVRKTVIVIGDAQGKDPEPVTGYTLSDVVQKAFSVDPAQIYTVPVGSSWSAQTFFQPLSTQTGGQMVVSASSSDLVTTLQNVILQAGTAPQAAVTASTSPVGTSMVASAAGTTASSGDNVVSYKWNWGDGTPAGSWDDTTTTPRATHTYSTAGTYTITVEATSASGLSGLATTQEVITAAATASPASVTGLTGSLSGNQATLTWQPSPLAQFYLVTDTTGNVVDAFTPTDYSSAPVTWQTTLNPLQTTTWNVVAVNAAGQSTPVPVTVQAGATISTVAGSTFGYAESPSAPLLNSPSGITSTGGNLVFLDSASPRVRQLTPSGTTTFIAGTSASAYADGTGAAAKFNWPQAVTADTSGNLYVADTNNNRIRKVTSTGVVTTLAGTGTTGGITNGTCSTATFNAPRGITYSSGVLYVADSNNHAIRAISLSTCSVTTVAGSTNGGYADGTGTSAKFLVPQGLAIDGSGNVIVADSGNNLVRKVTPSGVVTTLAGNGTAGNVDGSSAEFNKPRDVAVGADGSIYVADTANNDIRKIAGGSVTTVAGNGAAGFHDGLGTGAQFNAPTALTIIGTTLYVTDTGNSRIRAITNY